jgi:hypothetical protein
MAPFCSLFSDREPTTSRLPSRDIAIAEPNSSSAASDPKSSRSNVAFVGVARPRVLMVSVGFPLMSPAMPLSPPASYTLSSIEYRYTAPVATPYAFNASLAPTAKMLPSADTDTEDPKRARYMPLSIDSDMEYGDDK